MKKVGRKVLRDKVLEIIQADYNANFLEYDDSGCCVFTLESDNNCIKLTSYIKNISSAYLSYDPSVERIQIPPIPSIHKTEIDKIFLLIGYSEHDGESFLVCWDPQRYVSHGRYRSAYVYRDNIRKGLSDGYYSTVDHNNKVYICKKGYFKNVVKDYIRDSFYEGHEW